MQFRPINLQGFPSQRAGSKKAIHATFYCPASNPVPFCQPNAEASAHHRLFREWKVEIFYPELFYCPNTITGDLENFPVGPLIIHRKTKSQRLCRRKKNSRNEVPNLTGSTRYGIKTLLSFRPDHIHCWTSLHSHQAAELMLIDDYEKVW